MGVNNELMLTKLRPYLTGGVKIHFLSFLEYGSLIIDTGKLTEEKELIIEKSHVMGYSKIKNRLQNQQILITLF